MQRCFILFLSLAFVAAGLRAAEPATRPTTGPTTRPVRKIIPGKVIVPTEPGGMRRPWGELLSIDFKTRTGTFRNEGNDEVTPFIVLPYSELYHHAAFGDLQDYRIGERIIFRLHQNSEGKWIWLTYFQDEMNMLFGHNEYFYVDRIDAAKGEIEYTQGNLSRTPWGRGCWPWSAAWSAYPQSKIFRSPPFIRDKGLILETDDQTRYWKNGEPATFADIHVGGMLRAKTHGIGKGKHHRAWEVFLDDASLEKFQKEQQAVHSKRLAEQGWPGYVDAVSLEEVQITLFQEGRELAKGLKVGLPVRVAAAGTDRKAGEPVEGTIKAVHPMGNLNQVTITLHSAPREPLVVAGVARVWLGPFSGQQRNPK